ncbi:MULTISPECIES: hypothetical protein [Methylobacterium]|uniref:Uncharacterized protein n=1 Tax=Methylobacterium isbiliense TaxID=315478 RepID=A0ABQ4SRW7_9HYPH|nr:MULTISPECIES: hypothetical protein [Methylobacterium]MBY0296752.1 hypothetical protein [Methylobacterium sp.]MDN3625030.1 hypothetical protein [Methylobacterium isbiliense]GJE04568.1 hypothetical protein GMJLKIPL_6532 [Methylobacterium isbiliense]
MTYLSPGTPENVALAQHVNGRLRAEARIMAARAFLFRAIGLGVFAALGGAGAGAAFYGYATMNDVASASDKLASALTTALNDVTLKTKGEVTLTDNTLKLEGGVPQAGKPDVAAITTNAGKSEAPASAAVRTSFTVFKTVPYLDGSIVTGWNFKGSESKPEKQYCYVTRPQSFGDGTTSNQTTVAIDGQVLPQPARSEINFSVIARNCVWFDPAKL